MLQPGVHLLAWGSKSRAGCWGGRRVEVHFHSHRGHAQGHAMGQQEGRETVGDIDAVAYGSWGGIAGLDGQGRAQALLLGRCWIGWRRWGGVLTWFKLSAPPVLHALELNVRREWGRDFPLLKYSLQLIQNGEKIKKIVKKKISNCCFSCELTHRLTVCFYFILCLESKRLQSCMCRNKTSNFKLNLLI